MFECFKSKPGAVHQPSSREAVSFGSEKVLEKKSEVAIAQTEIREMKDEWTHSTATAIKSQISMRRHRRGSDAADFANDVCAAVRACCPTTLLASLPHSLYAVPEKPSFLRNSSMSVALYLDSVYHHH